MKNLLIATILTILPLPTSLNVVHDGPAAYTNSSNYAMTPGDFGTNPNVIDIVIGS